jgi:hypothetical protein
VIFLGSRLLLDAAGPYFYKNITRIDSKSKNNFTKPGKVFPVTLGSADTIQIKRRKISGGGSIYRVGGASVPAS